MASSMLLSYVSGRLGLLKSFYPDMDISALGNFSTIQSNIDVSEQTFWHLCRNVLLYRNIHVPKCFSAEMSLCQNIQVLKCPCAEKSLWGKVYVQSSLLAETSMETKCPRAEMSMVMKCPCQNVSCQNVRK